LISNGQIIVFSTAALIVMVTTVGTTSCSNSNVEKQMVSSANESISRIACGRGEHVMRGMEFRGRRKITFVDQGSNDLRYGANKIQEFIDAGYILKVIGARASVSYDVTDKGLSALFGEQNPNGGALCIGERKAVDVQEYVDKGNSVYIAKIIWEFYPNKLGEILGYKNIKKSESHHKQSRTKCSL